MLGLKFTTVFKKGYIIHGDSLGTTAFISVSKMWQVSDKGFSNNHLIDAYRSQLSRWTGISCTSNYVLSHTHNTYRYFRKSEQCYLLYMKVEYVVCHSRGIVTSTKKMHKLCRAAVKKTFITHLGKKFLKFSIPLTIWKIHAWKSFVLRYINRTISMISRNRYTVVHLKTAHVKGFHN